MAEPLFPVYVREGLNWAAVPYLIPIAGPASDPAKANVATGPCICGGPNVAANFDLQNAMLRGVETAALNFFGWNSSEAAFTRFGPPVCTVLVFEAMPIRGS